MQVSIEGFQLSPQQLRLCSIRQECDIYHAYCSIDIAGTVDSTRLKQAVNSVVAQNDIFRTAFRRLPGVKIPVQVIKDTNAVAWQCYDLRSDTPQEQAYQIEKIAHQLQAQPIALDDGPFLYCTFVALSTDKHILLTRMHALHADNASLHLFAQKVAEAYGTPSASAQSEESIQYIQVSEWQNELLVEEDAEDGRVWWSEKSLSESEAGSLPDERKPCLTDGASLLDSKTQRRSDFIPAALVQAVDAEIQAKLEDLAARYEVTPSIYLLTCWNILLWRLIGQNKQAVSVAVDGRVGEELSQVIGPLTKYLPIVSHLHAYQSVSEVLPQVKDAFDEALQWQLYFSHQEYVTSDNQSASLSYMPFSFEYNAWPADHTVDTITFSLQTWNTYQEPFKVKIFARQNKQALSLEFHYDTALFGVDEIRRLSDRYYALLTSALDSPLKPIGELDILGAEERAFLLTTLNNTAASYPEGQCLHRLFEAQALKSPAAIALSCGQYTLTYAELDQQANQVAHYLRSLGIGPEGLVGIYMQRSLEMVVAILGVLKAEGAYVPMDPLYPAERLAFMIADANVSVVLSQQQLIKDIPQTTRAVALDQDWEIIARHAESKPLDNIDGAYLAYVIYTSGSTGYPKGVMISHRGLVNYLKWCCQYYAVADGCGSAVHSSPAFDLTITSLFSPLLVGRTVHLLPDEQGIEGLGKALRQESNYSLLKLTPAHLDLLNHFFSSADMAAVAQTLVIGGEALLGESLNLWRKRAPQTRFVNEYGPTETVVGCCIYEVPGKDLVHGNVPIGRPIANTRLYLLDMRLQPVPLGVPGELYIGGHGVARGYLRRADLTAERFIPDVFANEPGMRLYKTGDRARYLPDGNLEFLGRTDHQVKIRGFRIELGEIEAVLSQHPAVAECAVLAREDVLADKRLVAYVTINQAQSVTSDDLRRHLQETLPEYMLPSAFVFLKMLPLTPNGKVDREALPAPDTVDTRQGRPVSAPRNPIEEVLVAFWQQLLRVEQVGIHDDFFELGGHSLLATQLASRIANVFQVEVPLLDLFEAPTVAGIAMQIEALLRAEQKVHIPPLVPVSREQDLPLSFAQQRLWFLDQLEPGSPAYNMPGAVRLKGPLEVLALQQSLEELVRRHESLRTTFGTQADQPVQVINPPTSLHLIIKDLSEYDASEWEGKIRQLIQEEAEYSFDLAHGPLFRAMLLKLAEDEHVLLHTMHHIISDGWSMGVLLREATALYNAFVEGKPSPLAALPIQYADYSVWQRQWLQGEVLDAQIRYWMQRLEGIAPLELPIDLPRPAEQTFHGQRQSFRLPAPLVENLKRLSQREGATFFMTLLTAFQILLARYTGQDHIPVGTPIANRTRAEVEGLIGFFLNTLVLYTDLSGNPTFLEALARVREVCYGAYAHQDLPFEKLVEILQPGRDLSRSPLFQVMLILQNTPEADAQQWKDITWETLSEERTSAKFELTMSLAEAPGGLYGTLEYNTDLFEPDTITRLLNHFHILLESIVLHPEQRLADLSMLNAAELQQLLQDWNATATAFPADVCLHQLFEEQVVRSPHAIAVLDEHQHLSYQQLNMQANRLARALRQLGIKQESCVGVCLERSCSLVVAILAVLKAGGTYLPLDPATPEERLYFMLTDAHAVLLLTQAKLAELIESCAVPTLLLDQDESQWRQEEDTNLQLSLASRQAAYIIYTSGSTGVPKGVVGHHRGMVNRLNWAWQHYPFTAGERCCQKTSLSFVDAIAELFAPLLAGIPIMLLSGEQSSDPQQLVAALAEGGISRLVLVPSLLRALLHMYPDLASRLPHLAYWVSSGEALLAELVERFQRVMSGQEQRMPGKGQEIEGKGQAQGMPLLLNVYGSSEVAADATVYGVVAARETSGRVPIGSPLANTRVYLLDQAGQPVPVGVVGEVYVGGEGLARGYFGRPDLTAEKFVPNPWCGKSGERMYRTGDLARWLANGALEYQGRSDHQVKVRGFRIELGEIESVLTQHPLVDIAVITPLQEAGGTRLVAYIVPSALEPEHEFLRAPAKELRGYLLKKLPEYMLPSLFVVLDTLPLTFSGKVNRRALPSPYDTVVQSDQQRVEPRTPLEEVLAALWKEVLGLQHVGVHANFFELGGHSLLATQVISRIRSMMHIDLPLRNLFEAPTIAGLAELIEPLLRGDQAKETFPLVPVGREAPLSLSFAQQRLWFLYQWEPTNPFYNIVGAVRLVGQLDHTALRRSFDTIMQRHEVLRTTFEMLDTRPIQVITPVMRLALPLVDLSALDTTQGERLLQQLTEQESRQPFDLAQGPLLRLTLLRTGAHDHVLLLTIHHIAFDGWSMGVFIRELAALYQAYSQGLASPLSPLPFQYADYAVWQRQWLQGKALEAQVSYWSKQLAGIPELLELPTDHPRPAFQRFQGDKYHFALDVELTRELAALCQREGVTLFMTLLAAFQILLARYSGQQDIVVGTGIANRTRAEIEGLIGFFVNTLVLRTDVSGEPTFIELLNQVRRTTLEAYAHQDLPFEYLVEALQPERNLSYAPLFQVAFVLQNAPMTPLELPGITLLPVEMDTRTAKNDLALYMSEGEDRIYATLEYNTDLFERETIGRFALHLQNLLAAIVTDPERSVKTLPLLSQQEQQQVLVEWNATHMHLPQEEFAPQQFELQAAHIPDAIALVLGEHQLTYGELDRRTNQLAHYLQVLGVGPETLVGVCMERSLELIISLLGILKAGGAFVPFDPSYPQQRVQWMCTDSQVPIVLTQQHLMEKLSECQTHLVALDSAMGMVWAGQPQGMVPTLIHGEHPAYMIYTSGSTGQPKGVQVTHQGLRNLAQAQKETFHVHPQSRVLQFASCSFDAFIWETVMALLSGAALCLCYSDTVRAGDDLLALLNEQAITVVTLPPSVLTTLEHGELPTLSTLIVAGESCSAAQVEHWSAGRSFYNAYGPTETTVCATIARCRGGQRTPPIGGPIGNTEAYILDDHLQPLPIGVPGELYLGGVSLARGYHRRADVTAERFIPHPFVGTSHDEAGSYSASESGARLYKTGDRARYLPNGEIEFLGRIDHQVKLRGYRIELGEVEACLRTSPFVQDAAVLVREDLSGDRQLVAYVVARPLSQLPVDHLETKQDEQVGHWQTLYEEVYAQVATSTDPLFNITGWNSSYTGLPLPAEHMREWVEQTVAQLQALRPRHVLEIGCGTGLLLLRLAPHCQRYVGTDFSSAVLAALQEQVQQQGLHQVQLLEQRADQLDRWLSSSFDLLVLNSVVQYFPSLDYLQGVLHQALRLLRPGGVLFVGDVRNFSLLKTFHTSIELAQAPASLSVDNLRQRIALRWESEEELVVAPAFFRQLCAAYPQLRQVQIHPKHGQYHNELTCYRYDVVLQVGGETLQELKPTWIDWQREGMNLTALRQRLIEQQPELVGLRSVPNARLSQDLEASCMIEEAEGTMGIGNLRALLQVQPTDEGIEPDEFWKLAQELSYIPELSWASERVDGSYDVLLRRPGLVGRVDFPADKTSSNEPMANTPLATMLRHKWLPGLRGYLQDILPEYMIPALFMPLEYLPMTPNGKLDRRALPAPERPQGVELYEAPLTLIEELLAGLWSEILGLEQIGRRDNFFELGGHSLLATQLISRIRTTFQVELPLRQLFATPTIAGLAEQLEKVEQVVRSMQMPSLLPVSRLAALPLSFAQQRLWFIDQLNPANTAYLMPNAWKLSGVLNMRALEASLKELIRRHESLRTTFSVSQESNALVQAGQPIQIVHADLSFHLPVVDLCGLKEQEFEVQRLVAQEVQRPCDLAQGPLLRACLLRLDIQEHLLLLTLHHIISDGWSMLVLARELTALYQTLAAGRVPALPPLPIQYADYAVWQRQWLRGEILEAQLGYWWRRLAGAPALKLPVDHPRPAIQSFRGAQHLFAFPKELSQQVMTLSRHENATLFMTLLAAFQILLYRLSGQEDIVLGTDSANRNRAEIEGVIGFFINLLVLRTDLSGKPSFREALQRVRETVLGAYMHQEAPFELLVERLAPNHALDRTPLIQALFVLQNLPPLYEQNRTATQLTEEESGLVVAPHSLTGEVRTAKFDLAVFMREQDGQLHGAVDYNADLFEPDTIVTLMARFERLLQSSVRQPNAPIDLLNFLAHDEQSKQEEHRKRKQPAKVRLRDDQWFDLSKAKTQ